jgi:uncharacterized protein (TIGR03000 family)
MFRQVPSLTGLISLTVLGWLLSGGPAAAQNQGYSVWAHRHDGGGGGSGGGWRSRGFFVPQSRAYYYDYAPAFAAGGRVTRSQSYNYAPAATSPVNDRVTLNLTVPADAKLWVEGSMIVQTGTQRQLVSPPIQPGYDYSYDIQVSWEHEGREVTRKSHITVHAGDVINLTFPVG